MAENLDFTYVPEPSVVTHTVTLGTPTTPPQADAGWYALQIERYHPVEAWKDQLALVPEQFRPKARDYLVQRYKLLARRKRLAEWGKQSPTGNREIERLKAIVQRM